MGSGSPSRGAGGRAASDPWRRHTRCLPRPPAALRRRPRRPARPPGPPPAGVLGSADPAAAAAPRPPAQFQGPPPAGGARPPHPQRSSAPGKARAAPPSAGGKPRPPARGGSAGPAPAGWQPKPGRDLRRITTGRWASACPHGVGPRRCSRGPGAAWSEGKAAGLALRPASPSEALTASRTRSSSNGTLPGDCPREVGPAAARRPENPSSRGLPVPSGVDGSLRVFKPFDAKMSLLLGPRDGNQRI